MARPRTPIGTWGDISCTEIRRGCWEAVAWVRERDGKLRRRKKRGGTRKSAENNLKEYLATIGSEIRGKTISLDSHLGRVSELWLADIEQQAKTGDMAWSTVTNLKSWTKNWVLPVAQHLQMRELTVGDVETMLDRAMDRRGHSTAAGVKTAISLLCDYAVRHRALEQNVAKQSKRLKNRPTKEPRGLSRDERVDLLTKLAAVVSGKQLDARGRKAGRAQAWLDLPDVCEAFLSTGLRVGELLALTGANIDVKAGIVRVEAHIVREKGAGLIREPYRKGSKRILLLHVPDWSQPMWKRRKLAAGPDGPLFPSVRGGWLSPPILMNRLREAFDACGYEWLTSHALGRKTVARVLTEAGLGIDDVADQLGNTAKVAAKHYAPARPVNPASVAALEKMR